jgi:hypothetical protein
MTRTVTTPNQKSATQTLPTLSQMVRDGQADAIRHRQRTREALQYWFRQSERLNIARAHHRLRGTRFTDFARRIGVDRASAFQLVKLHKHRDTTLAECREERAQAIAWGETYFYPGWRTVLERHEVKPSRGRSANYAWRQGHEPACVAATSSPKVTLYEGDNLTLLRSIRGSIQGDVCITSPPYFQKFDYQNTGQHGLESSVAEYLRVQVSVFHEVQRLLCEGGTCFIVIGDTSNNYKLRISSSMAFLLRPISWRFSSRDDRLP